MEAVGAILIVMAIDDFMLFHDTKERRRLYFGLISLLLGLFNLVPSFLS